MVPDSDPTAWLPFEHLLDQLARQGFRIGVEHRVRLQLLLSRMADSCSPADLKTLLCPLFSTNAAQQDAFYRAFDACYPFLRVEHPDKRPLPAVVEEAAAAIHRPAIWRRPWIVAAILALLLTFAIGVAVWRTVGNRTAPIPANPSAGNNQPGPGPTVTQTSGSPLIAWYVDNRPALAWMAVGGPLIIWLVWELYRFRKRVLLIRRSMGKTPPYSWPVRADVNPEIYEPHELAAVSRTLHRRYHSEAERLDVPATIAASIASLGFPTFRYRRDSRLPDYLFLIDRAGFRDQQSQLYDHLATMLRAHGLYVTRWFFEGDPRVCWNAAGDESVHLEHLQHVSPDHRLLLFATGESLLDAVTGRLVPWHRMFQAWPERAVLSPEPTSRWGARELTLATQFAVVPATLEGLGTLAAYFELSLPPAQPADGEGDSAQAVPGTTEDVEALRRYLNEDVFQWLCACAVYPELQWPLTLSLGALPCMKPGLLCEENLTKLLRLDWFRTGSIPDDRRRALIAQLDPHVEREVREAIVKVLEETRPPGQTFASTAQQFQIAYQRVWLAPADRKARRALKTALENMTPDQVVDDHAYLDASESVSRSPLQLVLPRRLRKVFYPAGGPWLEARSSVRLLVSLAAVVVALIGMRLADRLVSTPSAAGISAESPEARPQPFEPTIPAREPAEGQQAPRPAAVPPSSAEAAKRAAAASPSPTITELPLEPIPRPTKTEPPKVTPPRPSVRPTFDSAVEAYARALTRRDEVALRAVYPSVPREVIEAWSRQDSGVKDSSVQIIHTRAEFESPIRVRLECTFFFNSVTNAGGPRTIRESRLVTVEKHGENWDIVDSRRP